MSHSRNRNTIATKHPKLFWAMVAALFICLGVLFETSTSSLSPKAIPTTSKKKASKKSKWKGKTFAPIPSKNKEICQANSQHASNSGHICANGPRFYSDLPEDQLKAALPIKKLKVHQGSEIIQNEIMVQWKTTRNPDYEKGFQLLSWNETTKIARYSCSDIAKAIRSFKSYGLVAEPNFIARTAFIPNDTRYLKDQQNYAKFLGLEEVWESHQGSPELVIAILDTGIDPLHGDLTPNLLSGVDLTDSPIKNKDLTGHGTAMAGIIGAKGNNEKGVAGVVWNCKLLPIRVADQHGIATYETLATGIHYAADHGAKIINISLGSTAYSAILHEAVQYATQNGCLIIAAAGNDKSNSRVYPACFREVMCVVAASDNNNITLNTNVPSEAEVAAPGKDVMTTWPLGMYAQISGTSCSAAYVTGEAALLWSLKPDYSAAQIRKLIVNNTNPIPLIEKLSDFFEFGTINIKKAVTATLSETPLLEIKRSTCFPKIPVQGKPLSLYTKIINRTNLPANEVQIFCTMNNKTEIQKFSIGALSEKTIATQSIGPSKAMVASFSESNSGSEYYMALDPTSKASSHLQWNGVRMNFDEENCYFDVGLINKGLVKSPSTSWVAKLNQQQIHQEPLPSIGPGMTKAFRFSEPRKNIPSGTLQVLTFETGIHSEKLYFVFKAGIKDSEEVKTLYQQGGDVDFIVDMPYRLRPSGSYVPLMVFLPDNGGNSEIDYLYVDSCRINLKSSPETDDEGVLVYEDSFDAPPSKIAAGIEIVDEEGGVIGEESKLNLFEDKKQFFRGRSNIFRIPRTHFPVEGFETETPSSFAKVEIDWSFYRILMTGFEKVEGGSFERTLSVQLPTTEWPELPGANFYFDTHVHTVAEWSFAEGVNLFAPEKAYGGPIQMIKESSYAIGLTDSLEEIKGRIITTDHNCFFHDGKELEDSPNYRPTYGPTSPSSSIAADGEIKSEWTRMQEIFGDAAGEEISFYQNQFALVPMGAHMLSYRGEHFDGTWHGGSEFSKMLGEGDPLELKTVLKSLATPKEGGLNKESFTYAAHPYSTQGWHGKNIEEVLGFTENAADYIKPSGQFVFKGLQLFNGRGERSLPTEDIYFDELNPFINPNWKAGSTYWDATLQKGLVDWQMNLARGMPYFHPSEPDVAFIRKIFISAGSDAHGDFNYTTGRLAKVIDLQPTFMVDSGAFGKARSYVFTDDMPGKSLAEKGLNALSQGNSIVTDGLLLRFEMDSDGKWDSASATYHDGEIAYENADGLIGGAGKFDGGRSMLVPSGCEETMFKYKYSTTPEFGETVDTIQIYKATESLGNRFRMRHVAGTSGFSTKFISQLTAAGNLESGEATGEGTKKISDGDEGYITKLSCFSLGGFSHGDPDAGEIPGEASRAYTNPIWTIPVEFEIEVKKIDVSSLSVAPGDLVVKMIFPISMSDDVLEVKIKQLDSTGKTLSGDAGVLTTLTTEGWKSGTEIRNSEITFTNSISITGEDSPYPSAGSYSFIAYLSKKPKDYFGNELNSICKKFTVGSGSLGCFLATASLSQPDGSKRVINQTGTYYLNESSFQNLETLRNFRDQILLKSDMGHKFVKEYYHYAPTISEYIHSEPLYKSLIRGIILKPATFFAKNILGKSKSIPFIILFGFFIFLFYQTRLQQHKAFRQIV